MYRMGMMSLILGDGAGVDTVRRAAAAAAFPRRPFAVPPGSRAAPFLAVSLRQPFFCCAAPLPRPRGHARARAPS
jgi:hypothetical protein